MAALQRAVAGRDDHDVAVLVGQALGLDVARLVEELLDQALAAAEGGDRLADRGLVGSGISSRVRATLRPRPPPPKTALIATGRPFSLANSTTSSASLTGSLVPGASGALALLRDVLGLGLVAERLDRGRRRADPDQPGVDDGLGEVGVLGEEAVAGVHGVGAGLVGDRDDLGDVEVGLGRAWRRRGSGPRRRAARTGRRGRGRRRPRRCRCRRPCRRG